MEVLVAVGIFALLAIIVSSIFLRVNALQRQTASYQKLQNESRYILERIAREVRSRDINLPDPANNPAAGINFYTTEGDGSSDIVEIVYDGENLKYILNGESDNLNSAAVEVTAAKFFIFPTLKDVWGSEPVANTQPRVTIFLQLKNKDLPAMETKEVSVQTTISGRVYKR